MSEHFKHYDDLLAAVVALDPQGKVIYFNQAFLVLTQMSPRHLRSQETLISYFKSNTELEQFIAKMSHASPSVSKEIHLTTVHGHGPLTCVLKSIPSQEFILLTFNDLTVERTLYHKYRIQLEEIKQTHEKILQIDKLATLGELSAGISHEINNPLTVAYGYAQNIEWMLNQNKDQKDEDLILAANRVNQALEKISSIVNNMKSYVRTDDDLQEYCDLRDVVKSACELTHTGLAKDKIELIITVPNESLLIQGNKIELEQVIVNLLKNSFDALLDHDIKDPKVIVTLEQREHSIATIVEDNGPGINEEAKNNIFKPFFTTKEIGKGSGLGLSISTRLIKKHQGQLNLIPNQQGAKFEIILPSMEMSSMLASGGFTASIGKDAQKKILIIDDNPEVLNLLDTLLRQHNYLVIGSNGGEDALSLLIQTEIDLVVTDLLMPKISGSELSSQLHMVEPDLPIIYLSGDKNAQKVFDQDRSKYNIKAMISKPFKEEELLKAIADALKESP